MTKKERDNPDMFDTSRKKQVASCAGILVVDTDALITAFEQTRQCVKLFNITGAF